MSVTVRFLERRSYAPDGINVLDAAPGTITQLSQHLADAFLAQGAVEVITPDDAGVGEQVPVGDPDAAPDDADAPADDAGADTPDAPVMADRPAQDAPRKHLNEYAALLGIDRPERFPAKADVNAAIDAALADVS